MKDIRSLFESARDSGRATDVSAYVEAVDKLLENNPRGFISDAEYIISSGYGAQKFESFIEKYGLPIAAYDQIVERLEHVIKRGQMLSKPVSDQEHLMGYLENYRAKYPNCFMMYEWFLSEDADMKKYVDMYYSFTEAGQQLNKIIMSGSTNGSHTRTLMESFGNVSIPDLIIESTHHGDNGIDMVFGFLMETFKNDPVMNQWLLETARDVIHEDYIAPYLATITERSLQHIVEECRTRNNNIYRESKLMGDDSAMLEYYPHELKAIEDYITFKEYQLLFIEGSSEQIKCFNEIMSLYEELDGLIPADASCFNEATNPKNQTLKEIANRLNTLAKQAAKAVRAEFDDGSVFIQENIPYSIAAAYGDKRGPGGLYNLKKMVKKNISDISDFNEEWMENLFLFITFHVNVKRGDLNKVFSKVRGGVVRALKPFIDDEKINVFNNFDTRPTDEYSCWIAFKVGKTYAVGDSDIGMFESVAQIEEQVADQIIPMMALPNGQIVEAKWMLNTTNKKTGDIPGYISQNHDLNWGEGEDDGKRKRSTADDEESDQEPTLDDFRRPSATPTDDDDTPAQEPEDDSPVTPQDDQRAINNYYYYTYNNSLNRNSHSFNKTQKDDHSTSDDHSVRTRSDDHSVVTKNDDHSVVSKHDDHSTGKESTPDDVDGGKPADKPETDYSDPDEEYKSYGEAAAQGFRGTKAWERECRSFKSLFNLDLNKLGDVKSPEKKIAITIGAHKFTFVSSLGNIPGRTEKLSSYNQVPTAVHQFNVNKTRITSDKIGIDRCLLHYLKLRDNNFDPDMKIDAAIKKYAIKSKNIIFKLYGELALTFTCNLDPSKTFAITIDDDLACKDGEKNSIYTEGFMDKLKSAGKKIVNKIKGLLGMKKTIANLQSLDDPAVSSRPTPLTLPGTNIPLMKEGVQPHQESVGEDQEYLEVTNDLERLFKEGYYITERFKLPSIPGVTHESIEHVVNRLRKKFNAEILFIDNDNAIGAQIGPASVIETTREAIQKIVGGENVTNLPGRLTGYEGPLEKVILVNPKIMRMMRIKSADAIETIISHEYGHVLTIDQLTDDDWLEYKIKRQIIAGLVTFIAMQEGRDDMYGPEANMFYYRLKPEAIANQVMHIDPSHLTACVFGKKPKGEVNNLDLGKVVRWKIPDFIMDQTRMTSRGQSIPPAGLIDNLNYSKKFYNEVVTNKSMYATLAENLDMAISSQEQLAKYQSESAISEAVGDADDMKPKSDHPIKDTFQDIDRETVKYQQKAKKKVQDVQNAGRAIMKPVNRTKQWITKLVVDWKDKDENAMKEKMADPHARSNLFQGIRFCIKYGALAKAGILFNPIFLTLSLFNVKNKKSKEFRIRNEMIGELKTELAIIDEKIKDADSKNDYKAKYKLMRLKNEINKKLLRVGGTKEFKKII